jgi:hypothetical protein
MVGPVEVSIDQVSMDQVGVDRVAPDRALPDRARGAISPEVKGNVWIRSGGRCECTAACDHHTDRCATALHPGIWSIRSILPSWAGGIQNRLSMFEAVCELCRKNPCIRERQSPGLSVPSSQALAHLASAIQDK